jgi:hypothetical protein
VDLREIRVIDLIRDYPETLATFRGSGMNLRDQGPRRIGDLPGAGELQRRVEEALAWRGEPDNR